MVLGWGLLSASPLLAQPLVSPAELAVRRRAEFASRNFDDPAMLQFIARVFPDSGPWDLDRLTLAALYYSPELDIVRARIQASEGAIVTAATEPNPKLSFGLGFPSLVSLSLQMPADTATLRGLRKLRAEFLSQATRYEFYEAVWSLRSRLRAALLQLHQLEQLEVLDADEANLRSGLQAWAQQRFQKGELSRPELDAYQLILSRAQSSQALTKARKLEAMGLVSQLIGVPLPVFRPLARNAAAFEETPALPPLKELHLRGVSLRPDLQQALTEYRAALTDIQLEGEKADPIFQLGPGYQLDQGVNKFSLGFSVPLPVNDWNEGPIAERVARAKELAARFNLLQDRALVLIDQAAGAFESAAVARSKADFQAALSREQELRSARLLAAGETDRSQFLLTRLETVLAMRAQLDAQIALQRQLGLLEDALHQPLQGRLREDLTR